MLWAAFNLLVVSPDPEFQYKRILIIIETIALMRKTMNIMMTTMMMSSRGAIFSQ